MGKARSGFGHGPWSAAHGLDPAADVDVGLPEHHGAGGLGHGVEPRTAQSVDGDARDFFRETRQEQGHPGHVAVVLPGLVGAAEVDVLDLRGRDAAPLHEGFEGRRAEVVWHGRR